jgi:hypothetical protein
MKHLTLLLFAAALPAAAQVSAAPFLGRWDLTVVNGTDTYPDWLQLSEKDGKLDAFVQPRSGGARHWDTAVVRDGHLLITMAGGGTNPVVVWDLTAPSHDRLTGSIQRGEKAQGRITGVRCPALDRPMPAAWTAPEPLFNGKDLTGWEPMGNAANHWMAQNGDLLNETKGANLKTTRKFDDFKLHIEYNCPADGNSGIYLRGRYEVQVEYQDVDASDKFHSIGSIYSFVAPSVMLPRKPGTWESLDITLVGRRVTIVRNGVKTVDNQEIPGPTGGALDSNESEPGPFYIQGDHTGGMRYRNITISVPKL